MRRYVFLVSVSVITANATILFLNLFHQSDLVEGIAIFLTMQLAIHKADKAWDAAGERIAQQHDA